MSRLDAFVASWVGHQKPAGALKEGHIRLTREAIRQFWSLMYGVESVLDIGCAGGEGLVVFKSLGVKRCVGLTNQESECALVREKGFQCILEDMHRMSVPDNRYDLVYSRRTVEHSPVPFYLLSEFKRVASRYVLIIAPRYPFRIWTDSHCSIFPDRVWEEWANKLKMKLLASFPAELEKGKEMRMLFEVPPDEALDCRS